jgi:hypothetical protein
LAASGHFHHQGADRPDIGNASSDSTPDRRSCTWLTTAAIIVEPSQRFLDALDLDHVAEVVDIDDLLAVIAPAGDDVANFVFRSRHPAGSLLLLIARHQTLPVVGASLSWCVHRRIGTNRPARKSYWQPSEILIQLSPGDTDQGKVMSLIRRPKRVKTGPNSYQNYNSKGQQTSSSLKINGGTYTVKRNGQVKQTHNLGNGYSSVTTSPAPKKFKPSKKPKPIRTVRLGSGRSQKKNDDLNVLIGMLFTAVFYVFKGLFLGVAYLISAILKRK